MVTNIKPRQYQAQVPGTTTGGVTVAFPLSIPLSRRPNVRHKKNADTLKKSKRHGGDAKAQAPPQKSFWILVLGAFFEFRVVTVPHFFNFGPGGITPCWTQAIAFRGANLVYASRQKLRRFDYSPGWLLQGNSIITRPPYLHRHP